MKLILIEIKPHILVIMQFANYFYSIKYFVWEQTVGTFWFKIINCINKPLLKYAYFHNNY